MVNKNTQEVNIEMVSPIIIVYLDFGAILATILDVTLLPTMVDPNWLESSLKQPILLPLQKRRRPQPQHGHNENNDFTTDDSSSFLCLDTIARDLALKYGGGWEATSIKDHIPHTITVSE